MRLLARIVLALLAVGALVAVVTGCSALDNATKSDTAKAKVGDCINVTDSSSTATKSEPEDCSSAKAVYKVFQTADKKIDCAAEYTTYTEDLVGGGQAYMCLAPNFKQGSCYADVGSNPYKYVDCTSGEASFKVLGRIDGQTDELLCNADATSFVTVPDPKTTFCLGAAKG
ncbi:hypothetical protein OG874_39035 [Nocardia sp. NBC_00565]|uniref:LppU/SCO3897 family protein n=1 Tax=Nocardia sp. NBC_00565 TaxID=2975993 RepID=UPI002E80EDF9|nr:hypothetical protein [Nocardia sp. NBC_00565]WUC02638.1 hypothetical protein OG874_39035 [Nocardia sp. NBC_00565]